MKIELKHYAPYLPFGITLTREGFTNAVMVGIPENFRPSYWKMELRPLSHFISEITHNGQIFVPSELFWELYGGGFKSGGHSINKMIHKVLYTPTESLQYAVVVKLAEFHFDVFGLLDHDLATVKAPH